MKLPTLKGRLSLRERPIDRVAVMYQKWRSLLFLHWEIEPEVIQRTLPEKLHADTFEGNAYLGITPFFVKDARPIFTPAIPGISNFPEINVRTYVFDSEGNPGIWFYSLDATQALAVQAANIFFHLPYHTSEIEAVEGIEETVFSVQRKENDVTIPRSNFRYRFKGEEFFAESKTLDFFLIERYLLFSLNKETGEVYSGRVYHRPYPLYSAEVPEYDQNLLRLNGFMLNGRPADHQVYSTGVDAEVYSPDKVIY
ncbi:MAG: DUF2071 domain-containing protein [Ignavibacteria bacterium]|jgi:uncharacterized protein YqjF (DUF2071 family)|nr:DUF2071 domain-containing protein [Ignavibacteria bacterium]MCU7504006.1 DUF2071 domain-containing protein [Ignavibacteria bacterium]MCU7515378.1 DUF2071 domain-containing protein [Ignavibacteria bacterium]